jgi:hypothetical protein
MPSYSGKILITGSNGDQLSVPYMGVGFNLKEKLRRSMFSETTPFQVAGTNRDNIDVHHRSVEVEAFVSLPTLLTLTALDTHSMFATKSRTSPRSTSNSSGELRSSDGM